MLKQSKIIATLGPQTNTKDTIQNLVEAGVNCARINTAHGTFESYENLIRNTRSVSEIPIMIDVKGPELRLRLDSEIIIAEGSTVSIGTRESRPRFSYDLYDEVRVGDTVYVDGGEYELKIVDKTSEKNIVLEAKQDTHLKPNKGVNIPHRKLAIPNLSEKDKEAIQFSHDHDVEYIALSFVRNAEDVRNLKKLLQDDIGIIAKIENWQGVNNLDEILPVVDGVMVARGDMGIEVGQEKVPGIQKDIIQKAHKYGKMTIVATQMLETMTHTPTPTRAEVSDVANAVIDGADAVMLSGETAIGSYPVKTVTMMTKIAKEAEKSAVKYVELEQPTQCQQLSKAAHSLAQQKDIQKIVTLGKSMKATRLITRYRNHEPVIAVVPTEKLKRQLELCWGVIPTKIDTFPDTHIIPTITEHVFQENLVRNKENLVYVAGVGTTQDKINLLEQHNVHRYRKFHNYAE